MIRVKEITFLGSRKGFLVFGWTIGDIQKVAVHTLQWTRRSIPFGGVVPGFGIGNLHGPVGFQAVHERVGNVTKIRPPTRLHHFAGDDIGTIIYDIGKLILIEFLKQMKFLFPKHGSKTIVRIVFHALLPFGVTGPPVIGVDCPRETKGFVAKQFEACSESVVVRYGRSDIIIHATIIRALVW
jgi:hypothetical protein